MRRFADAWDAGDIETMIAALTEDIAFTKPPHATLRGGDAITAFLPATGGRWRLVPTGANAQIAFGAYRRDVAGVYPPAMLDAVTLRGDRIAEVVAFAVPHLSGRFGLPAGLHQTHM